MRIVVMIILRKNIHPCKQVRLDKTMGRLSEKTALVQFYQLSHVVAYIHSRQYYFRCNNTISGPTPGTSATETSS